MATWFTHFTMLHIKRSLSSLNNKMDAVYRACYVFRLCFLFVMSFLKFVQVKNGSVPRILILQTDSGRVFLQVVDNNIKHFMNKNCRRR